MTCQPFLVLSPAGSAGAAVAPAPANAFAQVLARLLAATRHAWQLDAAAGCAS
ncbi:hypothetical protein LMG3458_05186 [Achromobacter deleyi]|uniref:Uncharacterized protein n=1 Tax=Achromobacter deleyi TaxID=1353891 RepID=A0A6S7AJ93_9BURK|nr:hypothetical protein [Achromobacter deleyi]CAB3734875.1 hypothetical protein LMG3458_05186 [Achromobacter deleyi]CAB3816978.1 hypothetical protein LMG3482_00058 [Achromobacter deleyi]CAB3858641.1 hypothetical protein LMG3412_02139 [Achromobacter deleyi]CAB3870719.1 hypothetical protein LMG3481_02743 [Achromobacter deleyi]